MKAMILAAGEGTRLQPLTHAFPKPLVPIVNVPVMEHILRWLRGQKIAEVVINTWYKADEIEGYFGNGTRLGIHIEYSREKQLWGTAGSVRNVMERFNETFLVIGGDDLSDVNLLKLVDFHQRSGALATIGLKSVEDTRQYGVVVTDDSGKIIRFQEKPKPEEAASRLANTGIYLFEPAIFDFIPEKSVYDFGKQVFPSLLERGAKFYARPVEGYWCDIGSIAEYKESHWAILEGRCKALIQGSEFKPGVWAESGCLIHPSAVITPPCALGSGTIVRERAVLSGHVATGGGVVIEPGVRLDHVIAWENSRIGENSKVRDCVLSRNAFIEPNRTMQGNVLVV